MGINRNAGIHYILDVEEGYEYYIGKSILMLGKQDVGMTYNEFYNICNKLDFKLINQEYKEGNIDSVSMFKMIGFSEVRSLDVSDYEGADIIFDLNNKDLPSNLYNKFDFIYDGGTLEHIFDFATSIINTSKMLRTNGIIIHDIPTHNWMDHGFYHISPTLFLDFYKINNYKIKSIYFLGLKEGEEDIISADCRYNNNEKFIRDHISDERVLLITIAKKTKDSSDNLIPTQSYYADFEKNRIYGKYNKMEKVYNLLKVLRQLNDKTVAIYGVGDTTELIVQECHKEQDFNTINKLAGIYSSDREQIGNTVYGLKILDINDIQEDGITTIVIGSLSHNMDIIFKRIEYLCELNIRLIRLKDV